LKIGIDRVSNARSVVRYVGALLAILAAVVIGAIGWLKWHENELVFATAASHKHILNSWPSYAERIAVPTAGGTDLAALIFHPDARKDNGYWMLQLHGNGDSAFSPWQLDHCGALRAVGYSVLDIDYHGFGMTPGRASEAGMYADAEAGFQELLRRGVPSNRIILLGHSLGSGPAVWLATRHQAAALVLFGAFTSIPDAAADRYPFLPVRYAAAVHFDSLSRMHDVHIPVVVTHSRADTLIPYSHALRLFQAANEPKRLVTFETPADDHFGGHVDTLFTHLDRLQTALGTLIPLPQQISVTQPTSEQ
jgi:pimeloyl-ACP methyl ester carboxylesterase